MKVFCAFTLLAVATVAAASSSSSSPEGQKSVVVSSPVQQPYQVPAAVVPYPGQNYQFASEYVSPYAKSAFAPKAAPTAVPSSFGVYQPYQQQQQQYNFGPYQQYYPGASGYPAVVAATATGGVPYPTAYSALQPAAAAAGPYPTAYSAYPYAAQSYQHGGPYSPYPAAAAYQQYNGQFAVPSAGGQYSAVAPTVTPYSALPSVYQHQQSSFYGPAGQQYSPSQQYVQSQQYPLSQQYPSSSSSSYYPSSAAAATAADSAAKTSSSEKK